MAFPYIMKLYYHIFSERKRQPAYETAAYESVYEPAYESSTYESILLICRDLRRLGSKQPGQSSLLRFNKKFIFK
jgi:hypothetical protein